MPSAANAKSEKPASSEAMDNSPIRQIMTILEHKIRNLEKRKSKLTQYRDLQKAGKELNSDQKVAVAKYDEVTQTLEFAREISKQVTSIATAAERDAKKQAKREAWMRNASETSKIRDVLLILDCLTQMGSPEVRNDFLNGSNGAVKLTEEDLKVLDDLYPEVTPSHELNEEGQPGFHLQVSRAAEHLYAIIDGKPKEILGTTYTHIKEIVTSVHECGYFDKSTENVILSETQEGHVPVVEEDPPEPVEELIEPELVVPYPPAGALPIPPAPAVVPAPAYPLQQLPPITLQEVEHAYFAQQYPQQRPIAEVIGSQNFFFLQESEIDSPIATPQPPPIPNQLSPPAPIPTQTFTNQHFVQMPAPRVPEPGALPMPPQPHFPPHREHAGFPTAPIPLTAVQHVPPPPPHVMPPPAPQQVPQHLVQAIIQQSMPVPNTVGVPPEDQVPASPVTDKEDDGYKENQSPEDEDNADRKMHGQGDRQNRYRRYGRTVNRGMSNGHRGRGSFPNRQSGDGYRSRQSSDYQNRSNKDSYQSRQYDGYQPRHGKDSYGSRSGNDGYYGNGDAADMTQHGENGRERYGDGNQNYQGGFKSRGRGGPRGAPRGTSRPPRSQQYNRKPENAE